MSVARRQVRIVPEFFDDLDRQLDRYRGPQGEPSVHDFEVHELLPIVEVFATSFDDLPAHIPGRRDYRVLLAAGSLVPRYAVVGHLAGDGAIELVQVELDLASSWE